MKTSIKPSHRWNDEPVDGGPSDFNSTASGHSASSPCHPAVDPRRARVPRSRFGFRAMLAFCVVLLALGVSALLKFAPLLRG